jgi:hypothetical protein
MKICDSVQERLAELGAAALDDAETRRHVSGCPDCTRVLEDLRRVDAALEDLPSPDAPDVLVEATLRAVRRADGKEGQSGWSRGKRRFVASALAASLVVVASLGVLRSYMTSERATFDMYEERSFGIFGMFDVGPAKEQVAQGPVAVREGAPGDDLGERQFAGKAGVPEAVNEESDHFQFRLEGSAENTRHAARESAQETQKKREVSEPKGQGDGDQLALLDSLLNRPRSQDEDARLRKESELIAQLERHYGDDRRDARGSGFKRALEAENKALEEFEEQPAPSTIAPKPKSKADGGYDDESGRALGQPSEPDSQVREEGAAAEFAYRTDQPTAEGSENEQESGRLTVLSDEKHGAREGRDKNLARGEAEADSSEAGTAGASTATSVTGEVSGGGSQFYEQNRRRNLSSSEDPDRARLLAKRFLESAASLESLAFQEPRGYWANTYIPGDPAMRLLQARLAAWDRQALGQDLGVGQPFDAPQDAALAAYLHADRSAVEGPTRMRVQVGLKGAERQGGHRPAMNVGLVVDGRSFAKDGTGPLIPALITALEQARQPGDRFSLTVAGPAGGLLVPPEQFRHGPLRVAIDRLFGARESSETPAVDLVQAVSLAAESVRQGDDPGAVLGSSLVLLVTGASLAEDLAALEEMAHGNAVTGVPLSVVSLGTGAPPDHIDRLVAAGQGNRRILESAGQADSVIDRELHAASRAVARAVRLRIRLAPGVELIDVLDSRRLEEPQAERVREAEQAIDQRLARNLGIEADRGKDEDGIQIVIPNFYAGDAHVVLLDVVAEKPGPIADLQVRYKDVLRLRNGVAEAALSLGADADARGPLERNVLKNLVAWELARRSREASRYLEAGDLPRARALLAWQRDLIQGLRLEVAGWSGDPDLAADQAMLAEYLAVLNAPASGDAVQRRHLADSLRYAGFRKLQSAAR